MATYSTQTTPDAEGTYMVKLQKTFFANIEALIKIGKPIQKDSKVIISLKETVPQSELEEELQVLKFTKREGTYMNL